MFFFYKSTKGDHHHSHECSRSLSQSTAETSPLHPKPAFVAIIREQSVDVYDAKGERKTFKSTSLIIKIVNEVCGSMSILLLRKD